MSNMDNQSDFVCYYGELIKTYEKKIAFLINTVMALAIVLCMSMTINLMDFISYLFR